MIMGKKKIAIVLSGCGVYDGTEIHEAVMTMLAVVKHGAECEFFAPDMMQHHVINHLTGKEMNEKRNVLIESARIARGKVKPLSEFNANEVDALIFPGGFGAAKNLSTFAFDGANCKVIPDVEKAIKSMVFAQKPIGALCIAPTILAKIIGDNVELTVGSSEKPILAVNQMGAKHRKVTDHSTVIVDSRYKIVSAPCYMLDADIAQISLAANAVIFTIMEMIK